MDIDAALDDALAGLSPDEQIAFLDSLDGDGGDDEDLELDVLLAGLSPDEQIAFLDALLDEDLGDADPE